MKLQVSTVAFVPLILAAFFCTAFTANQCQGQDLFVSPQAVEGKEPTWYPYVFARGADRQKIQNLPLTERPYRPMHFYGNTIRRSYFRGNPAPLPRDFVRTASNLLIRF